MNMSSKNRGFTLVELMIAVAIIAIISAIGLPLYRDYVQTAREGKLATGIATMEVFQEDFRLRTGNYLTVAANAAAITAAIGWEPRRDDGSTYSIAAGPAGSYQVTATDEGGTSICRRYPDDVEC